MRIREEPFAAASLLQEAQRTQEATNARADGLHASDLIYCLRKTIYKNERKATGLADLEILDPKTLALFLTGAGHHVILQGRKQSEIKARFPIGSGIVARGEEIWVHATLDLWEEEEEGADPTAILFLPGEIKSTRKSAGKDIYESPHYIEQLAEYCVIWRSMEGRLYGLFLNGDYKTNRTPMFLCWRVEFAPSEMYTWEVELYRRATIVSRGVLPQSEHYTWECEYCPFNETVGGPCTQEARGVGKRTGFFTREVDFASAPSAHGGA